MLAFQGMRRGPRRRDLGWGKKVEEETHRVTEENRVSRVRGDRTGKSNQVEDSEERGRLEGEGR